MYKCLDMDKIHFIEGDTDSAYWAISGNPDYDYHQQFKYVIKDHEFYNNHVYEWFPNPNKGIIDEKKILLYNLKKYVKKLTTFNINKKTIHVNGSGNIYASIDGFIYDDIDDVLNKDEQQLAKFLTWLATVRIIKNLCNLIDRRDDFPIFIDNFFNNATILANLNLIFNNFKHIF